MNDCLYWFTWEVMGQLAFSKSFKMIQEKKWHRAISLLHEGSKFMGLFSSLLWLLHASFTIPLIPAVRRVIKIEQSDAIENHLCIGKNLAYMEMCYVVSLLVAKHDLILASEKTTSRVVEDIPDQFMSTPSKLELIFDKRKVEL